MYVASAGPSGQGFEPLYWWYVCYTTYNEGYWTLAWLEEGFEEGVVPSNPSCVPTQVKRVFSAE
jgi:hypothetical protein